MIISMLGLSRNSVTLLLVYEFYNPMFNKMFIKKFINELTELPHGMNIPCVSAVWVSHMMCRDVTMPAVWVSHMMSRDVTTSTGYRLLWTSGMSDLVLKWARLPKMWLIHDFLWSDFSTFWLDEPKCTEIWS